MGAGAGAAGKGLMSGGKGAAQAAGATAATGATTAGGGLDPLAALLSPGAAGPGGGSSPIASLLSRLNPISSANAATPGGTAAAAPAAPAGTTGGNQDPGAVGAQTAMTGTVGPTITPAEAAGQGLPGTQSGPAVTAPAPPPPPAQSGPSQAAPQDSVRPETFGSAQDTPRGPTGFRPSGAGQTGFGYGFPTQAPARPEDTVNQSPQLPPSPTGAGQPAPPQSTEMAGGGQDGGGQGGGGQPAIAAGGATHPAAPTPPPSPEQGATERTGVPAPRTGQGGLPDILSHGELGNVIKDVEGAMHGDIGSIGRLVTDFSHIASMVRGGNPMQILQGMTGIDMANLPKSWGDPFSAGKMQDRVPQDVPAVKGDRGAVPEATAPPGQQANLEQGPNKPNADTSNFIGSHGGHSTLGGVDQKNTNGLDPRLQQRLIAAGQAYKQQTGRDPVYGEGYRDDATQMKYWRQSHGGRDYPVARPRALGGRGSFHETGMAMDLPDSDFRRWLKAGNAQRFGLGFPVRGDPPHIQMTDNRGNPYPYAAPSEGSPRVQPAGTGSAPAPTRSGTQPGAGGAASLEQGAQPRQTVAPIGGAIAPTLQMVQQSRVIGSNTPPTTGFSNVAKEMRAPLARVLATNPETRNQVLAMMFLEDAQDPIGPAENFANRVAMTKWSPDRILHTGFYGPINHGQLGEAMRELQRNPQLADRMNIALDTALSGSNVLGGATDHGSPGDNNYDWQGGLVARGHEHYNDWGGFSGEKGVGAHTFARRWREDFQRRIREELRTPGRQSGADESFQMAGDVIPPERLEDARRSRPETPDDIRRELTRGTLSRALGGTSNVLPMTPPGTS